MVKERDVEQNFFLYNVVWSLNLFIYLLIYLFILLFPKLQLYKNKQETI